MTERGNYFVNNLLGLCKTCKFPESSFMLEKLPKILKVMCGDVMVKFD